MNILAQATGIHHAERSAVGWAFAYFFCLLCGYYILRSVRDEMGIQGGVENLQWVFTGTFLVMLAAVPAFGTAVARIPRARLIPVVYGFFIANILVFYLLLEATDNTRPIAGAFFIWTSVFNLFVVSVFWSFMADIFSNPQAKRLFGIIAAGGSAGALAGPSLTIGAVDLVGLPNLLLCSVAFLMGALVCVFRLNAWQHTQGGECEPDVAEGRGSANAAIGGSAFAGFFNVLRSPFLSGIGAYIILSTTVATFLYFTQAYLVRDTWSDPNPAYHFLRGAGFMR